MSRDTAVVLFARLPRSEGENPPGERRGSRRGGGPLPAHGRAQLAATASSSRAASRTLCFSEASEAEGIQRWVEAMGDTSLRLAPQCASPDLGERMRYALTRALERGGEGGGRCAKAIVVGTDVPDLSAAHVDAAAAALDDHDVVFGPAVDGVLPPACGVPSASRREAATRCGVRLVETRRRRRRTRRRRAA